LKSLTTVRKCFKKFQEIVKKVYGDKDLNRTYTVYKHVSTGKEGETVVVVQWHLSTKASITDIAAEVENDQRESVSKHAQAHGCLLKRLMPLFTRI
jgi:hypothetical protein